MRLLAPLLLPLALCAPTNPSRSLPELSVSQWSAIQSGVFHRISSLTSWSWSKAEEVVHDIEADLGIPTTLNRDGNDESKTIWEQLKDDPNSFSRLVKILEVGWAVSLIGTGSLIGATTLCPRCSWP